FKIIFKLLNYIIDNKLKRGTMANFKAFYNEAKYIFKDRIFNDYARCYAYGIDASCYFYIPKIVIIAKNEDEIKQII
ncbi:hypothetical protein ACMYAK_000805, partial [Campylobacter jejuni]